ncbi:MAG TPA: universal stress protein [Pyrinomonadaceae bacterium]
MKILLAVDGSPHGEAAADEVSRLPWPAGSEIRVISVAEMPLAPAVEHYGATTYYAEALKGARRRARDAADGAAAKLRLGETRGLKIDTVTPTGFAGELIIEEAETWGADLVVLGSQGEGFWERLLLGSVARAVASRAPCSVEIVRGPSTAGSKTGDAAEQPPHQS